MRIVAFAWTTPALVLGAKTCTRRDWDDDYARRFKVGELVQAYDRSQRVGGQAVGTIRLVRAPYYSDELPEEDFEREGFAVLGQLGLKVDRRSPVVMWAAWRADPYEQWIVRFELVGLTPFGEELKAKAKAALATAALARYYREHPEAGHVSNETMRLL